jgi:AbrB family looped-hinge helix DNA binding protein
MRKSVTTVTERGQVSIPARLRKSMGLKPGQRLVWDQISQRECRVIVPPDSKPTGAKAVLGFARRLRPRRQLRTRAWMKLLREGE